MIVFTHLLSYLISNAVYDKKTERMWAAEASIKLLLDNPSKEMAVLIKEAQEQYDSE